jgi:hypothetical protein
MKYSIRFLISLMCLVFSIPSLALQERHTIFVRQGGEFALTEQGKEKIQQTGEILLTHGFDNRSIVAVYALKDKGSQACAKQLAALGLFEKNKIHLEEMIDMAFYQQLEKKHENGHVIIIDDNRPSVELIETLTHATVDRASIQPYIIPFTIQRA